VINVDLSRATGLSGCRVTKYTRVTRTLNQGTHIHVMCVPVRHIMQQF